MSFRLHHVSDGAFAFGKEPMSSDSLWALLLSIFFAVLLFSGGNFLASDSRDAVLAVFGLFIIAISLWRLRDGLPTRSAKFGLGIFALGVILMVSQQIELPSQIWSNFPGRSFLLKDFAAGSIPDHWAAISMSPYRTRQDIISLVPALAMFLGVCALPPKNWMLLSWSIVGVAVVSSLIGLVQRFQGSAGMFNFFPDHVVVTASGFFANHNHFAAQLYCAIPLIAALALYMTQHQKLPRLVVGVLAVVYIIAMVAGLGATGSRMGTLLAMVAVLASIFLLYNSLEGKFQFGASRFTLVGLFVGIVVFAQLGLVGLLRASQTDLASDYRGTISSVSFTALKSFFPVGSGFGSFVPAYQLFETPETLQPAYVNHAHNDWLELIIEGGLPMAIIIALFLIWFLARVFVIWRSANASLLAKAFSISASLLLLHSIVDYPLRTPPMMAFFAIAMAMLSCGLIQREKSRPRPTKISAGIPQASEPPKFRPRPGGFGGKMGAS